MRAGSGLYSVSSADKTLPRTVQKYTTKKGGCRRGKNQFKGNCDESVRLTLGLEGEKVGREEPCRSSFKKGRKVSVGFGSEARGWNW